MKNSLPEIAIYVLNDALIFHTRTQKARIITLYIYFTLIFSIVAQFEGFFIATTLTRLHTYILQQIA